MAPVPPTRFVARISNLAVEANSAPEPGGTMSSFVFTFLSRKALGQAEQSMLGGTAGVRDEVGFLIIHQRYADHFFPGTPDG
jgi:hypothetical protein